MLLLFSFLIITHFTPLHSMSICVIKTMIFYCIILSKHIICCHFAGPHLHFELREEGKPMTLNNVVISGYLIIAGMFRRDAYCSDPIGCQYARYDGKYCATRFKQIEDGTISCPSVRGNHGTLISKIYDLLDCKLLFQRAT